MVRCLQSALVCGNPAPFRVAGLSGLGAAILSVHAVAGTVTLNGTGQMYWSSQFVGSSSGNTQTTPAGNYGNDYSLAVPGQYAFLDQFGPQTSPLTGPGTTSPIGTYAFQDTYDFSIGAAAQGDTLAVSLSLNGQPALYEIQNLQFRLYEVPSGSVPGLTPPAGSTPVIAWTGISGSANGASIQASFSNLQSGTYFLDIAGTASGSAGGTYVGQLNLAPVPLPASAWLLLSGVAGLGVLARRRR